MEDAQSAVTVAVGDASDGAACVMERFPDARPSGYRALVAAHVDVVVFDLGGVLAGFGGVTSMRRLADIDDDDELWRRWLTCPWVRRYESGHCSSVEFAEGVVNDWQLSVSAEQFLAEFTGWVAGPYPGAEKLVKAVKRQLPVACLSNTNEAHWNAGVGSWPLLGLFDRCFLSFQIGLLKPDPEVFAHLCASLAVAPACVLFLDDNRINIEAATSAGLRSRQVRGVDEARGALTDVGVLS